MTTILQIMHKRTSEFVNTWVEDYKIPDIIRNDWSRCVTSSLMLQIIQKQKQSLNKMKLIIVMLKSQLEDIQKQSYAKPGDQVTVATEKAHLLEHSSDEI